MFTVHDTFKPRQHLAGIPRAVRVIETINLRTIILISLDGEPTAPYRLDYQTWVDLITSNQVEKIQDPFIGLPYIVSNLPDAAMKRFLMATEAANMFNEIEDALSNGTKFRNAIFQISNHLKIGKKTTTRWICQWLQAGKNPAVIVRKFLVNSSKPLRPQGIGSKRGRQTYTPQLTSTAPAHEISENIEAAYNIYIRQQKMRWVDAYREMLITQFKIPDSLVITEGDNPGLLQTPGAMEKYRAPSWSQFRYRCRQLKNLATDTQSENPRGKRGKATDGVPGPGFYEIDATAFQIQLVSRITGSLLIGRPLVYLIVETYDGMITGYAVSLENPSWAVAALALHNCFSDKGHVFKRLGLPYKSEDWPSHHLPTLLRADRAEFVSNQGQEFPASGIRVEVTPSMTPEAKGTVEGKHSEIKKPQVGRFNLPGRFSKKLERRQSNGKKDAALDIFTFEQILVEIIMDINGEPVNPKAIPPDALPFGANVASRAGLHAWALEHRAGFTRSMPPNFLFEHLLKTANATVTPLGLLLNNELYYCDRLRELGLLYDASKRRSKIKVAFDPNLASEIYFLDTQENTWIPAFNTDPEIHRIRASFAEATGYRAEQRGLAEQAGLNNHVKRRKRTPIIRQSIRESINKKKEDKASVSSSRTQIRENRAEERAKERLPIAKAYSAEEAVGDSDSKAPMKTQPSSTISIWDEVSDQ